MNSEKFLMELHDTNALICAKKILDSCNIKYNIKPQKISLFRNFLSLFLHNALTLGIDRKNDTLCIYVEECDYEIALKELMKNEQVWKNRFLL